MSYRDTFLYIAEIVNDLEKVKIDKGFEWYPYAKVTYTARALEVDIFTTNGGLEIYSTAPTGTDKPIADVYERLRELIEDYKKEQAS